MAGKLSRLKSHRKYLGYLQRKAKKTDYKSKENMVSSLLNIWYRDEKLHKQCKTSVYSMPEQVKMVIDNKVDHTKW